MSRYIVGIDLGTTNIAVAYYDKDAPSQGVQCFEIEQWIELGQKQALTQLPASRFQLLKDEFPPQSIQMTGVNDIGDGAIVGEWAQKLGAKTKGRYIKSAKSWLAFSAADANITLPETCQIETLKRTPLAVQTDYIAYLKARWDEHFTDHALADQTVYLTVPASFTSHARALTLQACTNNEITVSLVEEPTAAFAHWMQHYDGELTQLFANDEVVLVCDVGGGTTDLTLIKVQHEGADISVTRVAVGEHLLLGGDNIDLAIAMTLAPCFEPQVVYNHPEFDQLVLASQQAKERLLNHVGLEETAVVLVKEGVSLFEQQKQTVLTRDTLIQIVEGFFPVVKVGAVVLDTLKQGLSKRGLQYERDPAITRHCAAFIQRYCHAKTGINVPSKILFNGGSFASKALQQRFIASLTVDAPLHILQNSAYDLAVAKGACAQGMSALGLARQIKSDVTQNYFLILNDNKDAHNLMCICVLYRGEHSGESHMIHSVREKAPQLFNVIIGQPVRFTIVKELEPTERHLGEIVEFAYADVLLLPPLITQVNAQQKGSNVSQQLQATLSVNMDDLGILQLMLADSESSAQWKLSFELNNASVKVFVPAKKDITLLFERTFLNIHAQSLEPKLLRLKLEALLGERHQWTIDTCRVIVDIALLLERKRKRTAWHERVWFQLVGFCMRPGKGWFGDHARMAALLPIFEGEIQYQSEEANWRAFWIALRRILPGVSHVQQQAWFEYIAPYFDQMLRVKKQIPKAMQKKSVNEMIMVLGALTTLAHDIKILIIDELLSVLGTSYANQNWWWVIANIVQVNDRVNSSQIETWLTKVLEIETQQQQLLVVLTLYALLEQNDRSLRQKIELKYKKYPNVLRYMRMAAESEPRSILSHIVKDLSESLPAGLSIA